MECIPKTWLPFSEPLYKLHILSLTHITYEQVFCIKTFFPSFHCFVQHFGRHRCENNCQATIILNGTLRHCLHLSVTTFLTLTSISNSLEKIFCSLCTSLLKFEIWRKDICYVLSAVRFSVSAHLGRRVGQPVSNLGCHIMYVNFTYKLLENSLYINFLSGSDPSYISL
jgi:hypothetical protein